MVATHEEEHGREHGRRVDQPEHDSIILPDENLGEILGWYNQTSETGKVADVELMSISGYDAEFIAQHHRVRDLLEAVARYGDHLKDKPDPDKIYKALAGKTKMPIIWVEKIKEGQETRKIETKMDLRDLAQLVKMEEFNRYMGKDGFQNLPELRAEFIAYIKAGRPDPERYNGFKKTYTYEAEDKKTKRKTKKTETINYLTHLRTQRDDMDDFDIDYYFDTIAKNQIGLQWLGGGDMRDQELKRHHIENASHTLFLKTGRTTALDNQEMLWMPVCRTMSARDARSDIPKTGTSFRAEGHPHEVGHYEEGTGTTVEFELELLRAHRKEVALRDHNKTTARLFNAAVGLGARESMRVEDRQVKGRTMKAVIIGSDREGLIYKGLHNTYDKGMEQIRGYGLTDSEADDLILTKIIAPFICNNASDWLMCLAKASNYATGYAPEKAVAVNGGDWANFNKGASGFCVGVPVRREDADEGGLKYFFNYNDLIAYINGRVKDGDIEGASGDVQPPPGLTQAQIDAETEERLEDTEAEAAEFPELGPEQMNGLVNLFKSWFGARDWQRVLRAYCDEGGRGQTGLGTDFNAFFKDKMRSARFSEIAAVMGGGGEPEKKLLLQMLRAWGPAERGDFWNFVNLGVSTTGVDREVVDRLREPRGGGADFRKGAVPPAEYALAQQKCQSVVEALYTDLDPVEAVPRRTRLYQIVSRFLDDYKNHERARVILGDKINDPRHLVLLAMKHEPWFFGDDIVTYGLEEKPATPPATAPAAPEKPFAPPTIPPPAAPEKPATPPVHEEPAREFDDGELQAGIDQIFDVPRAEETPGSGESRGFDYKDFQLACTIGSSLVEYDYIKRGEYPLYVVDDMRRELYEAMAKIIHEHRSDQDFVQTMEHNPKALIREALKNMGKNAEIEKYGFDKD